MCPRGEKKGDAYQPNSKDRYEINMDNATMTVNGESRRFSEDEATNVRTLMDFISSIRLESTVWWEDGEGDPVDGSGTPTKPERQIPVVPNKGDNAQSYSYSGHDEYRDRVRNAIPPLQPN